jgi:hypothetical protein
MYAAYLYILRAALRDEPALRARDRDQPVPAPSGSAARRRRVDRIRALLRRTIGGWIRRRSGHAMTAARIAR